MEILILLAVLAAAYWAKNNLLSPEMSQTIELFPSRGATFAKRTIKACIDKRSESVDQQTQGKVDVVTESLRPANDHEPSQREAEYANQIPDVQAVNPTSATHVAPTMPEDSILQRHYLAQLAAERTAITNPYPTDSVLRRHHESKLIASLQPEAAVQADSVIEIPEAIGSTEVVATQVMPEDSVLKRHFLSQLQAELESHYPNRPSDATLKRHYAQLIQAQMNQRLAEVR